jgi:hypothetical protein
VYQHTPKVACAEARSDKKAIEVTAFMMKVGCQRATKLDEGKESTPKEGRKWAVSLFYGRLKTSNNQNEWCGQIPDQDDTEDTAMSGTRSGIPERVCECVWFQNQVESVGEKEYIKRAKKENKKQ